MADDVLTPRDLNRALLARQLLLARAPQTPMAALTHLLAIQGQLPRTPFLGLWSRLVDFKSAHLLRGVTDREVIRATMMRGTMHVMTAADFLAFRATLRADEALTLPGNFKTTVTELAPVLALARAHFAEPREFESLREVIQATDPADVRVKAYAARLLLPLVQAAGPSSHGFDAGGAFVLAKTYLGRDIDPEPRPVELLRRYLAAWGPATTGDFASWSGLKSVAPMFEALADQRHDAQRQVLAAEEVDA